MEGFRNYPRCAVVGDGELAKQSSNAVYEFHVIDISASGVKLKTAADLELNAKVDISIRFSGHIIEVPVHAPCEVVKKEKIGEEFEYALKFTSLSHKDRVEIDEIIRRTCYTGNIFELGKMF